MEAVMQLDIESRTMDEPRVTNATIPARRIYRSEELLQGRREIWIEHEDAVYRVQLTRLGKLIMTK
jgi:hemin uptake protein HemP